MSTHRVHVTESKNISQQAKQVSATCSTPENGSDSAVEEDENEVMAHIAKAKEELKSLKAQKKALAATITKASAAAMSGATIGCPPRGVSIQEGMGLSNNKPKYDAIRRLVRDLVAEVGINWETPWTEISSVKKAKLYQVACEEAPFLKKAWPFIPPWLS
ncbi:hypothetical protein EI94DRAFT_1800717 [Lactarius quietus]|nr:hypothetical protein EI94DRAFT_1800717 [Lactarius quietus]